MNKVLLRGGPLDGQEYETNSGSSVEFPIYDEEKTKLDFDSCMDRWNIYWNGTTWINSSMPQFKRVRYQPNQDNEYIYVENVGVK